MLRKIRSILIPIVILCFILGTAFTIILYGRGYRIDHTDYSLNATGMVVAQSEPSGAQIYVDGKLKTAVLVKHISAI